MEDAISEDQDDQGIEVLGSGFDQIDFEERVRAVRDFYRHVSSCDSPGIVLLNGPVIYIPERSKNGDYSKLLAFLSKPLVFTASHGRLLTCARCISDIHHTWTGSQEGGRSMKDHIGDADLLRKARAAFSYRHNKWRKSFMDRVEGKCEICGSDSGLELAHVTGVEEFFYTYHRGRRLRFPGMKYLGVEKSYRDDNLLMLCSRCHDAQTMNWSPVSAMEQPCLYLDLLHRRHQVLDRFEAIIQKRGWSSADDLTQAKLV